MPPNSALEPEVQHIVEIDVGEERRNYSTNKIDKYTGILETKIPRSQLRPKYGGGFG